MKKRIIIESEENQNGTEKKVTITEYKKEEKKK